MPAFETHSSNPSVSGAQNLTTTSRLIVAGPGDRPRRSRPDLDKATSEDGYSRSQANGVILWADPNLAAATTATAAERKRPRLCSMRAINNC
jgi:hypothetical protein